jgi:hypothetical protein
MSSFSEISNQIYNNKKGKTLMGQEDANGKVDPPGMNRGLRVYVFCSAQHTIKNLNSWEDRKKSRQRTTFPPTTQVILSDKNKK